MRNVERGSEIISLSDQRLVFQLPRGNLEVIYPKLLLYFEIKRLITEERDYITAYKEVKRHKLDMNLITDLSIKIFEEELSNGNFLKKFRRTDDLNLILNHLESGLTKDLRYVYTTEEIDEMERYLGEQSKDYDGNKVNYI